MPTWFLSPCWLLALALIGCGSSTEKEASATNGGSPATASAMASSGTPAPASTSAPAALPPQDEPPTFSSPSAVSLWVRGGTVVDGSGRRGRRADVIVQGERIAHVGPVDPAQKADAILEAKGRIVAPGFVDLHAHADPTGKNDHLLAMGVTSILVGQDGFSPDERIASYLAQFDKKRPRVNVGTLVGHATVRGQVKGGGGKKKLGDKQLQAMAAAVERALEQGAFGLSTGLEYKPGGSADADELAAIARPVGAHGGIVMSHMRSEDDDKIEASLDELLQQCKAAGARAHVSHLKIVLGKGEARAQAVLAKLATARASGMSVTADVYPYTASFTTIGILFPDFARAPNNYNRAKKSRREELLEHLRQRVLARNGPEATLLFSDRYAGRTLKDVADKQGRPFEELLVELGPSGAKAAYFVMDDAVVKTFVADPFVMFGTDGSASSPHPRGNGTFARLFALHVKKNADLSVEEFVRRASALPADTLRLAEQGTLVKGAFADIVVFDPDRFEDRATFDRPQARAVGMDHVVVSGAIAWRDGAPTKARAGRALRATSKR